MFEEFEAIDNICVSKIVSKRESIELSCCNSPWRDYLLENDTMK